MSRESKRKAALAAISTPVDTTTVDTTTTLPLWLSAIVSVFTGTIGVAYTVLCTGYAASPARPKYSVTGKGDAICTQMHHFMSVPTPGSVMNLYATDTEVLGHTLHYAGISSVGHTYRLSGQKGTWVFRGSALSFLGAVPPAMLLCSVPLLGGVRTALLTTEAPLKTPHGLTVHSAALQVVPAATEGQ